MTVAKKTRKPAQRAAKKILLQFEDLHNYNPGGAYYVPNEDPAIWEEYVNSIPLLGRAAAICSGGEIGLFVLLPRVKSELVLIDHAYSSLSVAAAKYALLRQFGWEKTLALFTTAKEAAFQRALNQVKKDLPEQLGNQIPLGLVRNRAIIARWWKGIPPEVGQKACRRLGRVSFLHGDLTDLAARGPFDLLYLSNALGHTSRSGRGPLAAEVLKAAKPGAYILHAGGHRSEFGDRLNHKHSYRSPYLGWDYNLCRTKGGNDVHQVRGASRTSRR